MRTLARLTIGLVLAALLLVMLQPAVSADGIPLTQIELHSTLRENRQIAYVKVSDSLKSQTLDLFLSVVSLEPGNNLTVMIPLRTRPYTVSGIETTEHAFKTMRAYQAIQRLAERQNRAGEKLAGEFSDSAETCLRAQATGIFGLMVMGMGSSSGDIHYELGDGMSMDLLSFNSTDSLSEFYASQGLEVPDNVREIIERYGSFNVGLINAVTRPPIDRDKFDRIAQHCPTQLDRFRDFVAENPTVTTYGHGGFYEPYYYSQSELSRILDSITDYQLRQDFSDLISATYGLGEAEGTAISFRMPLMDGAAYFPLGTTPAWNGVQSTQVIFEVPDNLMIDFDRKADEVFSDGKHYYVWDFGAESPDYDLEGTVKTAGLGTDLNRLGRQTEQYVYEHSEGIGLSLAVALFVGLWAAGFWAMSWLRGWELKGKRRFLAYLLMGAFCFAASLLLTIIFGLILAAFLFVMAENARLPPGARMFRPARALAWLQGILLLVMAIFFMGGLAFSMDSSQYVAIPMFLGFMGTVFILLHITFADETSYKKMVGAWFVYLALVAPAFLLVASSTFRYIPYCTMAFVLFLVMQTFLYIKYIKAMEDEPDREPLNWWGDEFLFDSD